MEKASYRVYRRRVTVLALGATLAAWVLSLSPAPNVPRGTALHLNGAYAPAFGPEGTWNPVVPRPVTGPGTRAEALTARCGDDAGSWLGMRWHKPVHWRINKATIPAYLGTPSAVTDAVRSGAVTVAAGRNDCGLAETLAVQQRFHGATDRVAGVTGDGRCGQRDGSSVVSFGALPAGTLAVTCVWWLPDKRDGRSVEADILVDASDGAFFLTASAGCTARWDLESTLTHEFGHVYGLGHVAYAEHGHLTMSDGLPECSTAYRGLGLGDYRLLQQRYGTRKHSTG
ncbi:MAG TPA: hypothetical protein VK453_00645 [Micromonosporaceae bacterium]|nr:hypothetical protein [Micromonosporaceae bacterium]